MTELNWEGKFKDGKKVTPVRIALPFQTIETINESATDREKRLGSLFQQRDEAEWRNRLIWGDKKYVLPSLLPEFAGKVNLIYIDPPFFTGTDQIISLTLPETEEHLVKEPSIIEEAAYRNIWREGNSSLMGWIYETLYNLRELLASDGAIFIRFDQYWSHYVKVIADEIFGKDNFQNDIALKRIYKNFTNQGRRSIQIATDSLFLYFKSDKTRFQNIEVDLEKTREGYWRRIDDSAGVRNPPERIIFGKTYLPPPGKHFKFGQTKIEEMCGAGKIQINNRGRPEYWVEASSKKPLTSNWTDISSYSFTTGYPTENSEALLKRVIKACSKKGDLVLDCFGGSGTTSAVAEKLDRRWITADIGRFAIHTIRKRLLDIRDVSPFQIQNLGKYERQQWMKGEFQDINSRILLEKNYRHFILELYHATPLDGYTWLHGARAGRMIHVGSVDAPITVEDIKAAIKEFWKMAGGEKEAESNGIDFLGWDFAFDVNETAARFAAANNVNAGFKKIPSEVLDKKAVLQGDIKFYELASLGVEITTGNSEISVTLKDFIIPPNDVPEEIQGNITHWSQWIDYWAVDWNYRGDTFHNEWQSYRTKKEPKIDLNARNIDVEQGTYTILVKVIDILGNDTTKGIEVNVGKE
jgi:adenine-specific DNA-methyltransferase